MKKIGIVGGVAWPSTAEYYAGICRLAERDHRPGTVAMPEMVIESLDIARAIAFIGVNGVEASWAEFDEYHRTALQRLERSGAEFAVIASNTCHHRLPAILRGVDIPVLDIFKITAAECARMGIRQVLVLGTALTMRSERLREVFAEAGVEAAGPESGSDRARVVELIEKLQLGETAPSRADVGNLARYAFPQRFTGPPAVGLACTELPLAFSEHKDRTVFEADGVRYVNAAALHYGAAFDYAAAET